MLFTIAHLQALWRRLLRSNISLGEFEIKVSSAFLQLRVLRDLTLLQYTESFRRSRLPRQIARSRTIISLEEDAAQRLSDALGSFYLAFRKGEETLAAMRGARQGPVPWLVTSAEPGLPALVCVSSREASRRLDELNARLSYLRAQAAEVNRARRALQAEENAFSRAQEGYRTALATGRDPRQAKQPEPRPGQRRPRKPARRDGGRPPPPGRARDGRDPFQRGQRWDRFQDGNRGLPPRGGDGWRRQRDRFSR